MDKPIIFKEGLVFEAEKLTKISYNIKNIQNIKQKIV